MSRRSRKTAPALKELLANLAHADPETRWQAARELGSVGDRSAVLPLEHMALTDDESFQAEGAFVDSTEAPSQAALDALCEIYARHPPAPKDIARVRAHLSEQGLSDRSERLVLSLRAGALEAVTPLLEHADPRVRLRAWNLAGHARGERSNYGLWVNDEAVRLAATQQDAYRGNLVRDALARFPEEPSLAVRRGICDLWLRYRARMGGWLHSWELEHLLVDPDPELHSRVAEHVLEVFQKEQRQWIDDPGGLRPIRARLAALLEPGQTPPAAALLAMVKALVDDTLAPFEETPPAREEEEAGWSVLSGASASIPADLRATLLALGPQRRAALGRSIGVDVLKALEQQIHPWFSRGMQDHATVDVFAVGHRETRVVLHFIADHYNYNTAQSGSDWADHYFFAGEAELDGMALGRVIFALDREVHLTEHQSEHYDTHLTRELVRDELRARRAGAPAGRAAFNASVSAVHAASDARAAAANARVAAKTVTPPPTTVRCPKCASQNVDSELLFDAYQLACKGCGHSEIFETYPDQDSDEHWYG